MSIIKNFMGNSGNSGSRKQGTKAQNCTICQAKFELGKDDFRIAHCAECIETDRVRKADYWRNEFMQKQANTLSPNMETLLQKLSDKKEAKLLLEGKSVNVRGGGTGNVRQFTDIAKDQQRYAASLEVVRNQVMEHLPSIVAELGLTDKIDIEVFADMIVPAKISTPIVETRTAKAAIQAIVFEEVTRAGLSNDLLARAGEIIAKGGKTSVSNTIPKEMISEGGITRLGAVSSAARQIRSFADGVLGGTPQGPSLGAESLGDPAMGMDEENPMMMDPGVNPLAQPQEDSDPMMGGEMPPAEVVGDVVRVPDDQEMSQGDPSMQGGMPTMNEGIIPNSEEAFYNQSPDLGQEMPQEGAISRLPQAASRVRAVKPTLVKQAKPTGLNLYNVLGRVAKNVPVQAIKLEPKARLTLDNTPAANQVVAAYNDGTQNTWSYYITDKGAIFTSASSEFYAETPKHFAEFLSSDSQFKKFAFLPEELMTEDEPSQGNPAEVALPGEGASEMNEHDPVMLEEDISLGEGDPSMGSLEPTVLTPSPSNLMQTPSLMNDQESIFNNSDTHVGNENIGDLIQDALADETANVLPEVENAFPGHSQEEHLNHAVATAYEFLYGIYASASENYAKVPGETHSEYLQRLNTNYPGALKQYRTQLLEGGPHANDNLEDFMAKFHTPSQNAGQPDVPVPTPGEEHAYDVAVSQVPPVPGHSVVRKPEGGQVIDVPAEKARNQQFQQTLKQTPVVAPPAKAPNPEAWKNLSGAEPAGLAPIPDEELALPQYDDPNPATRGRRTDVKPKAPAPAMSVAASLIQLAEEMGEDMEEDEFMNNAAPAMVEAGYSDDEIMSVYAYKFIKKADDCTVFVDNAACQEAGPKYNESEVTEDVKHGLHHADPAAGKVPDVTAAQNPSTMSEGVKVKSPDNK